MNNDVVDSILLSVTFELTSPSQTTDTRNAADTVFTSMASGNGYSMAVELSAR